MEARPDKFTNTKRISGETTNIQVLVLDWDVRQESKKTILLKNTGNTNSLDFCVFSKALINGDIVYQDDTDTLPPNSVFKAVYNDYQAEILLYVYNTEVGNSTTFQIEYGALIDR